MLHVLAEFHFPFILGFFSGSYCLVIIVIAAKPIKLLANRNIRNPSVALFMYTCAA